MTESAPALLYWEDIVPGFALETPAYGATAEEMLGFARTFNPQPIHADPEAAEGMIYGGLIASGWHTCALTMRALVDGFLSRTASLGSPGVDEIQWLRPNRPGDRLVLKLTCLEALPPNRPERGMCRFRYEVVNQDGATIMVMLGPLMFARRPTNRTTAEE